MLGYVLLTFDDDAASQKGRAVFQGNHINSVCLDFAPLKCRYSSP